MTCDSQAREVLSKRFEQLELLGRGAFGAVFRAWDPRLNRRVVLKWLQPRSREWFEESQDRFRREARILAALKHPNLVTLLDFELHGSGSWIVFPDIPGHDLRSEIKTGRVGPRSVPGLLRDSLAGLVELHQVGVIHRDLKPENILVTDEGRFLLLDLGLAHLTETDEDLTATGQFLGTPAYGSPNRLQGMLDDPRDDLYSLGVVALELLTGRNPFASSGAVETMNRQLGLMPPAPHLADASIPVPLSILVHRMLAKEVADRPASAAAALEALSGTSPPTPHQATHRLPDPSSTRDGQPGGTFSRWKPLLGLGGILVLALGVFQVRPMKPTPGVAPGPSEPVPVAPSSGAEVRVEIPRLSARLQAIRGELQGLLGRRPRLLPADPATWRQVLRSCLELALLRRELRVIPGRVSREQLAELRQFDLDADALGLPQPFLQARSRMRGPGRAMATSPPWMPRWPWIPALDERSPWTCRSVEALQEARDLEARLYARFASDRVRATVFGKSLVLQALRQDATSLWGQVRPYLTTPETREQLALWLREGIQRFRQALLAAGMALRMDEPAAAAAVVGIYTQRKHDLRAFFVSELAEEPVEEFLPSGVVGPGASILRAYLRERARSVRLMYRAVDPQDAEAELQDLLLVLRTQEGGQGEAASWRCLGAIGTVGALMDLGRARSAWEPVARHLPDPGICPPPIGRTLIETMLRAAATTPEETSHIPHPLAAALVRAGAGLEQDSDPLDEVQLRALARLRQSLPAAPSEDR